MPTTLDHIASVILPQGLALLPLKMNTTAARVMLLAITQQEDPQQLRRQMGNGPARGLWQFEEGGGVKGVMNHPSSAGLARRVCEDRGVPFERRFVWEELERDDLLACAFARLLLFTDPRPLPVPKLSSGDEAWDYYYRNWRPGRPHPEKWGTNWVRALTEEGITP